MSHTPGPWTFVNENPEESAYVMEDKGVIGIAILMACGEFPKNIDDANVRLASAAPDLLAACKAALRDNEIGRPDMPDGWGERTKLYIDTADALKAAIAKARGDV